MAGGQCALARGILLRADFARSNPKRTEVRLTGIPMPRQSDLRFTFEVINGPRFDVVEFEHEEALSECFTLSVDLFSTDPAVEFGSVLDRPALLTIWRRDMPIRYVHGIVHAFVQGDTGFRRTRYSATIVPELKRAGLYSDWRIHQKANIPQLLESRIKELGITDYEQRMYGEHLTREYCVQPGETTLYFLNRVAAEEGIYLAYSHSAQGHRLIMGDHLISHGAIAGPVIYNATPGGDQTEPCIRSVTYAEQIRSSRFVQRDYFFRNPRYSQEHRSDGADLQHQGRDYEKFGYPGRYKYDAAGKRITGFAYGLVTDDKGRETNEGWNTEWDWLDIDFDGFQSSQCLLQEAKGNYDQFFKENGELKFPFNGFLRMQEQIATQGEVVRTNPPSKLMWYFETPRTRAYMMNTLRLAGVPSVYQP
ncbi:uncharacterized protein involved in type VI secretion and phage assembly [Paraburkholderia tropica]|uniref:type VI secretion system tip protein TssI/VgrG n=1 Tax=Paraburkholderia tropica TaxID=92647 RepID=UPI00161A3723|nr:type VI secretion system tip protein TssI/VgrG [Paraburkholderia tropica]MBB3002862.1 uncharacterized protein involved in type VI secretion and phage assembly [Paraburkholderia tropica]MBB6320460.1 uncharacterized protein involved in type VI secretion and phage assembly [Paraburkholderia tropica]